MDTRRELTLNQIPSNDDAFWFWRNRYWQRRSPPPERDTKTQRPRTPLMLCGHGVSLKIEAGTIAIKNGYTHYPQQSEEWRFFKCDLDLPLHIIMLDGSGSLTFDVLSWLSEQGVALSRITWNGEVSSVLSPHGYSTNPFKVKWQHDTRNNHDARMAFAVDVITKKIDGSLRTLEKAIPKSAAWEKAVTAAYEALSTLELNPPSTIEQLRVIEANCAAAYFRAWRGLPLKWRGFTKSPIPDDWREIGSRTSKFSIAGNRNASHPVNAMLNYAYAILETQLRIQSVVEGYDPTIGIMHESGNRASAFIFDIMEPERASMDRALLSFIKKHAFHPADFILRSDGVVRLNPQLARSLSSVTSKVARILDPVLVDPRQQAALAN